MQNYTTYKNNSIANKINMNEMNYKFKRRGMISNNLFIAQISTISLLIAKS